MRERRLQTSGVAVGLGGALALALSGCMGQADEAPLGLVQQDVGASTGGEALVSGQSCDALLVATRAELLADLSRLVAQVRRNYGITSPNAASERLGLLPSGAALALTTLELPAEPPSPPPNAGSAPSSFSPTTTHVPGIDEGDTVQTEGDRIYLADDGNMTLYVLAGWPAEESRVLASLPLQGGQAELLVHQGLVSVFTRIYGELPGVPANPYPAYERVYTKLTVVDTTTDPPEVRREVYIEGDYQLSRRQGSVVRAAIQQAAKQRLEWPVIDTQGPDGEWLTNEAVEQQIDNWASATAARIEATSLPDYLPAVFTYEAGVPVSQAPTCESYFVAPDAGLGATTVIGLDLADVAAPLGSVTVHGMPGAVAIGEGSLVVQQSLRREGLGEARRMWTQLHLFATDCADVRYVASGSTSGFVASLDYSDGVVRAATVEEVYAETGERRYQGNAHHVVTLAPRSGLLAALGRSPELGTNDGIYTALFTRDRAYIAASSVRTSESTDLVVVDLSDPAAPQLAGRLQQTFRSIGALLPAAENRLAAVSNLYPLGVAVQLFDVTDPSSPSLAAEHLYADAPSSGADDPRAITFLPERQLLAFPIADARYDGSLELFQFSADSLTRLGGVAPGLPVLRLIDCLPLLGRSTDPESVAALESEPAEVANVLAQCELVRPGPFVRRGLIREDTVFAISTTSIAAFRLDGLGEAPVRQLELP